MNSNPLKKIILGTAQLGQVYGINSKSKVSEAEAINILNYSKSIGINSIDTAPVYGNAENILGNLDLSNMKVVSKLPRIQDNISKFEDWTRDQIYKSLRNLKLNSIDTILFHDPNILLKEEGKKIYRTLKKLKKENIISQIGISIYAPEILMEILSKFEIDLVQAPLNPFDQRIIKPKFLKPLNERNIKIHARSIFLQGLILDETNFTYKYFSKWKGLFSSFKKIAKKNNLNLLETCLGFINSQKAIEKFLIGVDSINHLKTIISILNKDILIKDDMKFLSCSEEKLINPTKWPKKLDYET